MTSDKPLDLARLPGASIGAEEARSRRSSRAGWPRHGARPLSGSGLAIVAISVVFGLVTPNHREMTTTASPSSAALRNRGRPGGDLRAGHGGHAAITHAFAARQRDWERSWS
jgi:hypothetical protein